MPTKRSRSSQLNSRGGIAKHPSERNVARNSSSGHIGQPSFSSNRTFRTSRNQNSSTHTQGSRPSARNSHPSPSHAKTSGLRSSARIDEIRSRGNHSGQSDVLSPEQHSFKAPKTVHAHQTKRPNVVSGQRSKPNIDNFSSSYSKKTNNKISGSHRNSDRRTSQHTYSRSSKQASIAEHNLSGNVWSKENQNSKSTKYGRRKQKGGFPIHIVAVILCVVVVFAGAFGIDSLLNGNKIYQGVSIGEVDVSGLTKDDAIEQVSNYYSPRVSENVAIFYSTQEAQNNPQEAENAQNLEEQISYEESLETRTQWTIPSSRLDAVFDVEGIVDDAFQVGRDTGGFIARIQSAMNGWRLAPECSFNETTLSEILKEMTSAIGTERVNFNIEIGDDGIASVTSGHDGNEVVRDWLTSRLNETYFGSNNETSYVLETTYMPLQITEENAQQCADKINNSLAAGATFNFENQSWSANRSDLASWVTTSVEEAGDSWNLRPLFDEAAAKKSLLSSLHSNIDQSNLQVTFEKDDSGAITVSSNATGSVPLISDAIASMNEIFFVDESRTDAPVIELASTDLPSSVSFEDAIDFGLISEVSSFTTQYSSGAEARTVNIHTAADLLTNSIIKANGGSWSFNDTAGEATEDKGYQNAGAIVGGEYSDAIGGGICQVATTVFNAIYDAGYPVTERHNHTLRISSYPEGRDAAIAYPYMDLVWQNDSTSDVLLVMSYTNSSVTASLWGVDPGYQVSTDYGEWKEGEHYSVKYRNDDSVAQGTEYIETTGVNGSSISITRIVKDSNGKLLHEDLFESTYAPKDQVVVRGTA